MNDRILITGVSGMLGAALARLLSGDFVCTGISRLKPALHMCEWLEADLLDLRQTSVVVNNVKPDIVIHCAAMTNVDACERDPEAARRLHVGATDVLADYCAKTNAHMIYISTDSVFNGAKQGAYTEMDATGPLNVYGATKLEGEKSVLSLASGLVLRTNIFGWRPGRHDSFAEWVLRSLREQTPLTMFTDVMYTPIGTELLGQVVSKCVEENVVGLFHAGGGENLSKHEFALQVADAFGLSVDPIVPIRVEDKPLAAPRPRNMALDNSRLENRLGMAMPKVSDSIRAWKNTESTY
ncbi:MAG TPA: SDR family oxidoreductase [Burkholderiales bacterium]|jgi:dTDP-4-dehydrorhamnose reductase|nr:SDR family oxidoreductase [Burkholderiales bacterium]